FARDDRWSETRDDNLLPTPRPHTDPSIRLQHFIGWNASRGRAADRLAGADVEACSVPYALHRVVAAQLALGERERLVTAAVAQREHAAAGTEQADVLAIGSSYGEEGAIRQR